MKNNQDQSKPQGEAALCSKEVLAAFGDRLLNELMQGEWEPDFEWQANMLTLAQEMGLIRARPVRPDDDISEEYDFLWERVNAANSAELSHGGEVPPQTK